MSSCKTIFLGAFALSFNTFAIAQTDGDDQRVIERVIVESSRLEQTATEAGSSVTIITADDIEKLGLDFALDAIAAAPGVTINSNGAFGGSASVRIRGATSEQTLVLVDGVPVNDPTSPGGGFNFARFDTETIARIEILKGPQSTLWGTDAIGGVVSITTKRPGGGYGGSAFGEYGSFNTFRGGASMENGGRTGDFRLAIVGMSSDGISKADKANGNPENDPYEALTFSAAGGLNLGDKTRFDINMLWTDAQSAFDSFSSTGQGNVGDGDEISNTEEFSANATLKASLFNERLKNLVLVGYTDISRDNFTNGKSSFSAAGNRLIYRYQGTVDINEANRFAFGAEREESDSGSNETALNGLFALYAFKPAPMLTLTGGLRMDNHARFGSQTTGRAAGAFNLSPHLTLHASWGQGFKAPTLFQTTYFCCGAAAPNADLVPETSEAFDIGLDWQSSDQRSGIGITGFNQRVKNQISFGAGGYENIVRARSKGIEIYGRHQVTDWLSVSVDYALIDAKDGKGNTLIRVPKHSGDITVSFDPAGPFSGAVLVRYNGEEADRRNGRVDNWTRIDLSGRYGVTDRIELFARIENLFNEDYQQIAGYGTPGLSAYIGLRLRY